MDNVKERHLIIRADASTQIGTGHLMRCLALAQTWKDAGGHVVFITACQSEGLLQRLREEGFSIHQVPRPHPHANDWGHTKDILADNPDSWVVLDGYHFDEIYQQRIKECGYRLLVIDDIAHLKHYYADIVLNQNPHSPQLHYSRESYTQLMLGTKYVLLRREVLAWKDWERDIPEVANRLLVTIGGSDPDNCTLKVLEALQKVNIPALEVVTLIGALNTHIDKLEAAAGKSLIPIRLIRNADNVAGLMVWADMLISAGGTTTYEAAFMGLPNIVMIAAPNQRPVAEALDSHGVVINLGSCSEVNSSHLSKELTRLSNSAQRRAEMLHRGRKLVDGEGIARLLMRLEGRILRLRRMREDDAELLWTWANDPEVRKGAFSLEAIDLHSHMKWFAGKLRDPRCFMFFALDNNDVAVGQIRFDMKNGNDAEIDISVDKNKRGLEYAAIVITMGVQEIFRIAQVSALHAFVKIDNTRSARSFEKAGFVNVGLETVRGNATVHYVRIRGS